jgi:hypothetical protein
VGAFFQVDVLRNELFKANVIEAHGLRSAEQLVAWLDARNAELAERPKEAWGGGELSADRARILQKALDKAATNAFFLGLDWAWLNRGK